MSLLLSAASRTLDKRRAKVRGDVKLRNSLRAGERLARARVFIVLRKRVQRVERVSFNPFAELVQPLSGEGRVCTARRRPVGYRERYIGARRNAVPVYRVTFVYSAIVASIAYSGSVGARGRA